MNHVDGFIYSHTTIRVPGAAHAGRGPFTLVLVDLTDGRRVLGHLAAVGVPAIGKAVSAVTDCGPVPMFQLTEEQ